MNRSAKVSPQRQRKVAKSTKNLIKRTSLKRTITTKSHLSPISTTSVPKTAFSTSLLSTKLKSPFTQQNRGMKVSADELKNGSIIKWGDGDKLYKVQSIEKKMMGRRPTSLSIDLKCLSSGKVFPTRMMPADMVEKEELNIRNLAFLYAEGEVGHLIDNESYEQFEFPLDLFGKSALWIPNDLRVAVSFYDGAIFSIQLPDSVIFEVTGEDKHGSAKIDYKSVFLSNSQRLEVPQFINVGDRVKIKLENKTFMIRALNNEE